MSTPPRVRAATDVNLQDDATEVDRFIGGWLTGREETSDFDRELDDDPRQPIGDRGFRNTRFASGTGQFDLRSGEPTHDQLDEPVVEAAAAPVSLIMARKVVCVRADLDASEARSRMLARGVSGLPVVDNWGRAIGLVSRADLLEHEITTRPSGRTAADIMTPLVFSLGPDASIGRAAALMAYEGIHRIVIVDQGGYVVGLVSSLDISRWLGARSGHPIGQEL